MRIAYVRGWLSDPVRITLFTVSAMLLHASAEAQVPECSTVKLNEHECVIRIDRERPVTPLPAKVEPGVKVHVRVDRRPLDAIKFDAVLVDTVPPDPLAAIFGAFVTPAGSLVLAVTSPPPPRAERAPASVTLPVRDGLDIELDEMLAELEGVKADLETVHAAIEQLGERLKEMGSKRAGSSAAKDKQWTVPDFESFRDCFTKAVENQDTSKCKEFPAGGVAMRQLPIGALEAVGVRLEDTRKRFAVLPADARQAHADRLNAVTSLHYELGEGVKSIRAAQDALDGTVETLAAITNEKETDREFGPFTDGTSRTATVEISAKDALSGDVEKLGTVVIQWGGTAWELSTGALFSFLPARSFDNAVIVVDGQPQLDAAGGVRTRIVETHKVPMIVPAVFAHYRYHEWVSGGHRMAWLFTGGIGVNPYSASADFALSPCTYSYRGLMISPLLHITRDVQLTDGLRPGLELGADPPALTTERFWKLHFAIGLSYRIPIG